MPLLSLVGLFLVLASWASWAAWTARGSWPSWLRPEGRHTVIPLAPVEEPLPEPMREAASPSNPAPMPPLPKEPSLEKPIHSAPPPTSPPQGAAQKREHEEGMQPIRRRTAAPPSTQVASRAAARPSWQQLAHEGQFAQAYEAAYGSAENPGLRKTETTAAAAWAELSPGDLLLLSDVARLSRHPADAVPPLEKLLQQHFTDPRAPLAAFTLGRVLLDDLGRPREAAAAFHRVQMLEQQGPDGPLAQDALAREVEAWSRAGEPQRAHERALEYIHQYPTGRRLRSVRHYGELGGERH